jgi:phosphoribosylamine--glycine ligase
MAAVLDHRLDQLQLQWRDEVAVCVVIASGGYPGDYQSGKEIFGLSRVNDPDLIPFHAGTKQIGNRIVTDGGRVLSLTAMGNDWDEAREKVYRAIDQVSFDGMQYRKDIGK